MQAKSVIDAFQNEKPEPKMGRMKIILVVAGLFFTGSAYAEPLKARAALPRVLDGISLNTTYEALVSSHAAHGDFAKDRSCSYNLEEGEVCLSKETKDYFLMVYFRGNRLLRIQRLYGDSIRWDAFIAPTIKKYGRPDGKDLVRSTEYLLWQDKRTRLELHNDRSSYPDSQYSIVLMDMWTIREDEAKEKAKAPDL